MSLIKPDIYAGLVREKFEGKVKVANLAMNLGILKNTTVGETVTFPKFRTISNPELVVKGQPIPVEALEQTSSFATIKQMGKAVRVYDIDDMTAFGNHINEGATQQGIVFARQLDLDIIKEALTSPLKEQTTGATSITPTELNKGIQLFGDEADVEDMAGVVINSLLVDSFFAMNEFVDKTKTYNTDGNGIQRNGLLGFFRNIPVYVADHGTFDNVTNEAITLIIKKNSLAFMEKRDINIELERMAKLKATDIVGDYIYATKLVDDAGVVVLKKTL